MEVLDRLLSLLFPEAEHCCLCGLDSGNYVICGQCLVKIVNKEGLSYCFICGRYRRRESLTEDKILVCKECRESPPYFFAARSLGPYGGALKEAIYTYKYQGTRSLSDFFGAQLTGIFLEEKGFLHSDVLVPVPLSNEKLGLRGFNQAELIAVKVGRLLNLPVVNALVKIRDNRSQSKLPSLARRQNVQGMYRPLYDLTNHNVLLVDDIFTTGSTVGECARVLMKAGARSVGVLTLASGMLEKIISNRN